MSDDDEATRHEFDDAVNMTAHELEEWLGTDVTDTRWRYSLMNWGHDPEK